MTAVTDERGRAAVSYRNDPKVRAIVAQVAHRCWAGELPALDLDNVWEQLEQSNNLPQTLREKLLSIFG
ncbi:MAG: hypothetical protein ACK47M_07005 [Caldilinea sp.]